MFKRFMWPLHLNPIDPVNPISPIKLFSFEARFWPKGPQGAESFWEVRASSPGLKIRCIGQGACCNF